MKAQHAGTTPDRAELYEEDFVAWTRHTADLLRRRCFAEIDIDRVAEEMEDLGKRDLRELRSRTQVLLMHLLKWQAQPSERSASWSGTVRTQRREIASLLEQSPSLRSRVDRELAANYAEARSDAAAEMGIPPDRLPAQCPYTVEQILDREFLPE